MPINPLPLLALGGAALLLAGGKKKKKKPVDTGQELPDVTGDDSSADPYEEPSGGSSAKPGTTPQPGAGDPEPMPGPSTPAPDKPKRPLGPSGSGSCVNAVYTREAQYIDPAVADRLSQGALTLFSEAGYYFYIRRDWQDKLFDAALSTFASMGAQQTWPTLRSVVLREILMDDSNTECDWNVPTSDFDAPMSLVWDDGMRLMTLAQVMANYSDPHPDNLFKTGKRYTMPRLPLGISEQGFATPKMDQRVMILATDKSLQNAEHLIGRVSKLSGPNGESDRFEIRIVDTFQGKSTRPDLTAKHGFKALSNAYFSKNAPTGIYRFYQEGMV